MGEIEHGHEHADEFKKLLTEKQSSPEMPQG